MFVPTTSLAVGEIEGVGGDGGDGGRSAVLFRPWKQRGATEISEIGTASGEGGGTAPVSPAYKEEEANIVLFPNKEPPTISPTTPRSTRAVTRGVVDTEFDSA